jgi:hypothetical protein
LIIKIIIKYKLIIFILAQQTRGWRTPKGIGHWQHSPHREFLLFNRPAMFWFERRSVHFGWYYPEQSHLKHNLCFRPFPAIRYWSYKLKNKHKFSCSVTEIRNLQRIETVYTLCRDQDHSWYCARGCLNSLFVWKRSRRLFIPPTIKTN